MAATSALQLLLLPASELAAQPAAWLRRVLGAACFGSALPQALTGLDLPLAQVQVQALRQGAVSGEVWSEVWISDAPLRAGAHGRLRWRCNDAVLFGELTLAADELEAQRAPVIDASLPGRGTGEIWCAAAAGQSPPMQRATELIYDELFGAIETLGFPHLLRVWNHIPDINRESAGLEHYRQFNIGRQDAFLAHGRHVGGSSVPSASALGAAGSAPLVVYFIAGRRPPVAIENPRQLSAYDYPADYGPRAPTFSRANLACIAGHPALFISGTASIVGHRTLHHGDVVEQTREILRNIDAVLRQSGTQGAQGLTLQDLHYKVYVRHAADQPVIQAELRHAVGGALRALYLQADICRADLLVEIEAVALPTSQEFAC